ncbi:MAG TPA: isoaspartyl peptidase/L-asparaginase [Streptosporangiales bacterium]
MAEHKAAMVVHGGAGRRPVGDDGERQAAVRRGLDAGWSRIGEGALTAVVAAVCRLEDEPLLNAGIGACLNDEGAVELDAGVMEGTALGVGAVAAVRDVRHPVELARHVLEHSPHVLLAAGGASRYAREHGVELADPSIFVTEHRRAAAAAAAAGDAGDTVGAVARDRSGRLAVAVSTGGVTAKTAGRVGDSPIAGAGFYADDSAGAVCTTGTGEGFIRLCLAYDLVTRLRAGQPARDAAGDALAALRDRTDGWGGLIVVTATGEIVAEQNSGHMPWASASDD